MADLTPDQTTYLQGLRNGDRDQSRLIVRNQLTPQNIADFDNFKAFLVANGHPNPTDNDLFLRVTRNNFLRMLFYANDRDRNCLVLQNCFGFDGPPVKESLNADNVPPQLPIEGTVEVGRVVLIQRGNFQELDGRSDEDFFSKDGDTVYRNAQHQLELFLNMDLDAQLSFEQAKHFIANFLAMYPTEDSQHVADNPFIHGYLLPVRALINLFTDATHPLTHLLAQVDTLTFMWGITRFNKISGIGNFTLVIGAGDLSTGPIIEFRTEKILRTGEGDCPPRSGCQL